MTDKYEVNCDPKTKICTAKLKFNPHRAYEIGTERQGQAIAERVKKAGAEYLGFGFTVANRDIDRASRTIPFVASTATVDRYGDIIKQEGWVLDYYLRNPVVLFGHDSRALPIGKAIKCGVDKNLVAVLQFATKEEYEFADTVFNMICGGYLNTLSVGFIPLEFEYRYEKVQEGEEPKPWPVGRIYTKSELLENSVVPVPANPEALVVGREFAAAFKAVEIWDEEIPAYDTEKSEGSYFTLDGTNVIRHGQRSPVDTKVVDADPYLLTCFATLTDTVSENGHTIVRAGTESKAKDRAIAWMFKTGGMHHGFLSELVGADDQGRPVYRSLFLISKKETDFSNRKMSDCNCNSGSAAGASKANEDKEVVPFHAYPLAASDATWDASKEMGSTDKPGDWRKMSTIVLGDGSKKGDFKLPHHKGPGAKFATVRRGVANALARANQVKGASSSDKAGAKKHLQKHMAQFHKDDGKAFDEARFEKDCALIEAMREAAPAEKQETITRRFVDFILGSSYTVLTLAQAFQASKSEEIFTLLESEERMTDATANNRMKKAKGHLQKAKAEMESMYAECMESMGHALGHLDSVMANQGVKSGDGDIGGDLNPGEGDMGGALDPQDGELGGKLKAAHEHVKDAYEGANASMRSFRPHAERAMKHLKALMGYFDQEPDVEEPTDPDEEKGEGDGAPYEGDTTEPSDIATNPALMTDAFLDEIAKTTP